MTTQDTTTGAPRLTEAREREIEERLRAATPGPWEQDSGWEDMSPEALVGTADMGWVIADCRKCTESPEQDAANGALIAHAPTDIADLLAEVRALRAERDRYKRLLGGAWVRVPMPSDEPVQYVAVHPVRWGKAEEPTAGFYEIDVDALDTPATAGAEPGARAVAAGGRDDG